MLLKMSNLNSNLALTLGYLNPALNNSALFTGLLCDSLNSLTYKPRKGQSPTLSRSNRVILHLMLAFRSNNSNLNV